MSGRRMAGWYKARPSIIPIIFLFSFIKTLHPGCISCRLWIRMAGWGKWLLSAWMGVRNCNVSGWTDRMMIFYNELYVENHIKAEYFYSMWVFYVITRRAFHRTRSLLKATHLCTNGHGGEGWCYPASLVCWAVASLYLITVATILLPYWSINFCIGIIRVSTFYKPD